MWIGQYEQRPSANRKFDLGNVVRQAFDVLGVEMRALLEAAMQAVAKARFGEHGVTN